jgi:hypothetical protein
LRTSGLEARGPVVTLGDEAPDFRFVRQIPRDNLQRKIEVRAPRVHLIFAPLGT